MTIVIKAENVSKQYFINQARNSKHSSLINNIDRISNRIRHPFSGTSNVNREPFWALKDLDFEVEQGDRVGIIGRNGAGKSTLLKILSRITPPSRGRVGIKGRIASLLEVGTGFHPELTGRENIFLNGAILGMKRREIIRKLDEIVDFAEVEKFLDTPVKRYSSGMYVRLAFSVASHLDPEILIVDEVLAVGDAQFQKKCLGKMESVGQEGRTILFVSHNVSTMSNLCNKGILLQSGKIESLGNIEDTIHKYIVSNKNALSSSKIVDQFEYISDSDLKIEYIAINGEEKGYLPFKSTQRELKIVLEGTTSTPIELGIECRLYSQIDVCIGLYTPRLNSEYSLRCPGGNFHIKEHIELPKLNSGSFFIDIFVMDMRNNIAIAKLKNKIELDCEGVRMRNGWSFINHKHNGFMVFDNYEQK